MLSTSSSDLFLTAEAKPQPVTDAKFAVHTFQVESQATWPAEITDSVVIVVSGQGVELDLHDGNVGPKREIGRLGFLSKAGDVTNLIPTIVRKQPGTFSAREEVEVTVTYRHASGYQPRPKAEREFPMSLPVSVSVLLK